CNEATEFTCDNGQCVPLRARCNRRFECSDQSDETNCDCDPLTQFKCADGQCVASSARCNRRFECSDRSDEENCGCSRTEFTCDDGSCVDRVYRCDRVSNCPDNSDEFNCTCNPREFRCANGQCIPSSARCDRKTDCVDRSDERNCPTCTSEQFTCDNGNCIDIRRKCDRRVDCRDGSDERDCPPRTCTSDQFTCENGDCIDIRRKCDGRDDCRDGSDERDCAARCPGKFLCDVRRCIELSSVCDGRRNCNDNSDEKDCAPITCSSEQFTCTSGRCIDRERRCNRVNDCDDGSDESNCPCASGEISCDGTCFPRERRCDGERDCSDGSDEQNCQGGTSIYVSPQQMKKRFGTSASFMCNVVGEQPSRITWIRRTGTGGSMPPQAVITGNRLLIPDLRIEDAGDYLCQAFGSFGKIEAHARLEVEFVGPPVVPSDGPCGPDEVPCSNGACIYKGYYCDGDDDCRDGSDERNCPIDHLPCEPNEFRCDNGKCAMKIWRCDGDNDCGDRSDERNCEIEKPGSDCRASEFQCASRDQCIPLGYQCDGETDCLDRSDEVGCSKPTIITPPLPEITVEINGTFTIICEAIGVPTPLIVWRLNWGNIPNGTRVTVTSENGYGNLTIRNAIPQDAGAYTCEAVNNRGSIFAIPDANIIVRRRTGVCRDSTFNSEAYTENQCVKCFCFGQTQSCYSSSLQISQITMGSQVNLVRRQNLEAAEPGIVQYIPTSRQFEVKDFNSILRTGSWYWSLPHQFLKKQLNSYGGTLSYQVYYEVDGFENPTNDPDIILIGNGITLFHRADVYERVDRRFRPRQSTIVNIPLNESAWERSQVPSRGGPISQYATREDLMLVLENVTHILIRATYDSKQSLIRLGNVVLTTGRVEQTGLGRAIYVEECKCPAGYTGNSCEDCAPGFYRVVDGNNGRRCVACNCNQYSNECDPLTGICRNCRDNTAGPYCNECASGYYKDPRYGRCQSCPCPSSYGPIQFERSCFLDQDREVTCRCPPGYTGRRCERCARGYVGDPSIPGQFCYRQPDNVCDTRGSVSRLPNPLTGTCECKSSVTGTLCDTCKPETFYLSDANPMGCIPCFCMGVTQICQSSTWNRVPITLSFSQTSSDVTLTDVTQSEKIEEGFSIERQSRELVFTEFENYNNKILFWSLPQQFLGNKVTAYGGNLRFTLRYKAGRDNTPVSLVESLVTIRGSEIDLEYKVNAEVEEGRPVSFVVPMIENKWYKIDGNLVSRENFLMALANLQHIFIRATFTRDTAESAISAISLDVAEDRVTSRERAYQVEQCACPLGYKGLSCEDCDSGYTRTGGGLYLGLCEECRCNKHSTECDPENGVCKNCRHNTEGARCERCARGYYGDATRGTVNDCQKCPCPLTESPNQFSSDCVLDRDRQVTCTACPVGHEGRRCERCAPGYSGDPMSPGDYCKQISVKCECDDRGTMPNTECDPRTRQCQCKNNVEGRNCSTCRTGYFNLNKDLDMGCLKCFCMGITNICTSSYYYREEITPVLDADGSHNFALVNGRLSRTVTDGFSVNAARNEITFNNFEGSQREQDSLYFNLPPKFRGDKVSSYGGYLKFTLRYTASPTVGRDYTDLDVVLIGKQNQKLYHVFRPQLRPRQINRYEIHLVEDSFQDSDLLTPSRETFLTVLADISAILIRATYHHAMQSVTLGNLRMDIAGPNGRVAAPEVERCSCPEGYSGLSCQSCAPGFVRVPDPRTALGRCARCSCNGHSNSCDPATGVCQNCQHNTEGDRCERCIRGYYGDPTSGTPNDCRPCACPLTIPSNNFSPTCVLDTSDNRITCDKCPPGYTGRDCGQCAPEYSGNPRQPGGKCQRIQQFEVDVSPAIVREPLGSTIRFLCTPRGRGPFNVVWSRLDGQALPSRATIGTGPSYELTILDVDYTDAGRYVCSVTNPDGSNRDTGTLFVERPDLPIKVRIQEPTRLVKRQGDQAEFICEAIQFNSAANYVLTWRKDGGQLPSKAVEQSGVLYIPDLDQNDLGRYTCTGSQRGSIDNATAEIMFGEIPESPTVRIEPPSIRVQEGQRVELVCVVTGSPRPTIKWTKGNTDTLPPHIITDREGRLIIESVSPSDRAAYYCIAENYVGTSRTRATILVLPATVARVIVRRADIIAIVGQSEQMVCETDGTGVTLQWSREGGLPPGARQSGGVLTLTNIQPSFAGTYLCTGISITGTVIGRATSRLTVTGSINVKPTSRIEPAEGLTIGSGTTGTLRCIVTGEPAPTIVWTRSRGPLSSNHQVRGDVLRILQATPEDRDRYICTATNEAGVSVATVVVNIERREPPLVTLYPSVSLIKRQGESAMFQCRVTQGQPAPTVTWTRAGGLPLTERTKVEQNGVLMFRDLTQREQGEYICTSENVVGSVSATASLRVQGAPVIEITPGTTITVEEGRRLYIECVASGEPAPDVFWRSETRRRSDVLPDDVTENGRSRLAFDSVQKSDAGRYTCVARNELGETKETVEVIVNDASGSPETDLSIVGPSRLTYTVGQSIELTCLSKDLPNAQITWRRPNRQPLPPGSRVSNGVLYIPRITPEYAGEYICSLANDFQTVFITVTVTSNLVISPSSTRVRAGASLRLSCQLGGSYPYTVEWSKEDGVLSPQARESNGVLDIRQVTSADAGRYKCVATTDIGSSEAYADVIVVVPPSIDIPTSIIPRYPYGSTIQLICNARGSPAPTVRWERENGAAFPDQHQIRDGVLTIYNASPVDSGSYSCIASNEAGREQITFPVIVDNDIGDEIGVNYFVEGDAIDLECTPESFTESATFKWSKLEGPISRYAVISNYSLHIENAKVSDSGTYRCTLTAPAGSRTVDIRLKVTAKPSINTFQEYTTAALGSPAQLKCNIQSSGPPRVTWIKKDGELPYEHEVSQDGSLYIPRVREGDTGAYACQGSGQVGPSVYPVYLFVGALVPYFGRNNENSYLEYLPLTDAYQDLDILLSFRPESTDGLLLYNGQYPTAAGDFVCFGLQQQVPEFRFDVGSGPAIIRGNRSLELNKWHTVHLKRSKKNGTLLVNDEPAYVGVAPGQHEGLDLGAPLYLGSVPDYRDIPPSTGYSRGFVGSLSQVQVKGVNMNLGAEAVSLKNVIPYDVCAIERPCVNGGTCRAFNIRYGYVCECPSGFGGEKCEQRRETCSPGLCGPEGRCVNLPQGGYSCACPLRLTGDRCSRTIQIADPAFDRTSFISYDTIKGGLMTLSIKLDFNPRRLEDGIILYNAQKADGKQDFIALVVKDRHLEFRFDVGSGPAIIRSRYPLRANEWTKVVAERRGREGMLTVNDEESVNAQVAANDRQLYDRLDRGDVIRGSASGNKSVGLNLERPLYLGGVDPSEVINPGAGVYTGFIGCVGQLVVNERNIGLIDEARETMNIRDCGERTMCSRKPCQNNGVCTNRSPTEYFCTCPEGFSGRNCEVKIDICVLESPCNEGICVPQNNYYRCMCPLNWAGNNCQYSVKIGTSANFQGEGYIEISSDKFPRQNRRAQENLTVTITTTEPNGLIIWQGQKPDSHIKATSDYFAVAVVDGYLEFSYDLGDKPGVLRSLLPVNDGYPHDITVSRNGKHGKLKVDQQAEVSGLSGGGLKILNVMGNIFVGGVPDMKRYTDNTFSKNFNGCVSNLRLFGSNNLDFGVDALGGLNVVSCETRPF
ncbi:basement membrane-specific heparan sulfate proteoglycan core protein, partial [Biomphalaria glabrata]